MTKLRLLPMAIFAILACCIISCNDDDKKEKDDPKPTPTPTTPTDATLESMIKGVWIYESDDSSESWGYAFDNDGEGYSIDSIWCDQMLYIISGNRVTVKDFSPYGGFSSQIDVFDVINITSTKMTIRHVGDSKTYTLIKMADSWNDWSEYN